jgi:Uncharacterized conserved protein (DUF2075)
MDTSATDSSRTVELSRSWYESSIAEFLKTDRDLVLAKLVNNGGLELLQTQRNAWILQTEILKKTLLGIDGKIFLEFNIPRMGKRIDAVLIIQSLLFVLEFKVGESSFQNSAIDQVWDYALDLKNFHEGSHNASIIPVLVATESTSPVDFNYLADKDRVYRPILTNTDYLSQLIFDAVKHVSESVLDSTQWSKSSYRPTPTIIEAARSLYANHSVEAIARFDAGATNLRLTSRRIEELALEAKKLKQKIICFVTGVPGAGKTLVGLNLATQNKNKADQHVNAVFLSGNGPLVAVLREALTRDEVDRRKVNGEKVRKGQVGESVKTFIQNVHHFRDDALVDPGPPVEHIVIFDEAQRAWNLQMTANFMQRKKNIPGFHQSEPEFLISCMDRHQDWAVIVCLVGGGQEINTGEAGIDAWIDAINSKFPNWGMYISSKLVDSEYSAGKAISKTLKGSQTHFDDNLHLSVSMRSFRSENVSFFVKALLDCDINKAKETLSSVISRYPIVVTRNLNAAKDWVRSHARGSERFGLVASSKAQRLKPYAVDIRVPIDPVHWFLNGKEDTRSSYYLEDAATEFQVQGLELDWTCVTWDGDLRYAGNRWSSHDFRGNKWTNINIPENQSYLKNAYRVLLTRARQGMVIFVPEGDIEDPTRSPQFYDATFNYLKSLNIPVLG